MGSGNYNYRAAFRNAILLWSCELVLARISSRQLPIFDISVSFIGLSILALSPLPLIPRLPALLRRSALQAAGLAPLVVVTAGIVLPSAFNSNMHLGPLSIIVVTVTFLVIGIVRLFQSQERFPGSWFLVTCLLLAVCSSWAMSETDFPPPGILAGTAGAWILLALSVKTSRRLALGALFSIILALAPDHQQDIRWSAEKQPADGPDIFLLTIDTLRSEAAQTMKSYKRLSDEGIAFSSAQAEAPWTLPSLATIVTGLPYELHGAGVLDTGDKTPIHEVVPTLASMLSDHGYDTAAVIGPNIWVRGRFGFSRGFPVYEHVLKLDRYAIPRLYSTGQAHPVLADILSVLIQGRRSDGDADELVRISTSILEKRRDRPIFFWIHFFDPHLPYTHAMDTELPWSTKLLIDSVIHRRHLFKDPRWSTQEGITSLQTAYGNEVSRVDDAILRFLDFLDIQTGRERIVLLTSDHGEEFLDHGRFEHGHAFYQEVVGIPLVLSAPHIFPQSGRVETTPVGMRDIGPTLLETAGITWHGMSGQNLIEQIEIRPYVSQNLLYGKQRNDRFSVREGDWKAILGARKTPELYNLEQDPEENVNLASEYRAIAENLLKHAPSRLIAKSEPLEMDGEELRSLRSLGYIQ